MGEISTCGLAGQNFDITPELMIRKILERKTEYNFIFDKNDDKFAYDICAWRYDVKKDGYYHKNFLGYIEIEIGKGWIESWPSYYYCVSFLQRKIWNFDRAKNEWNGPKKDIDKAVYLKFNSTYTDCLCKKIEDIYNLATPSARNCLNGNKYNDSYVEMNRKDVVWHIDPCIKYIISYLDGEG